MEEKRTNDNNSRSTGQAKTSSSKITKEDRNSQRLQALPVTNRYPLVDIGVNLTHIQFNPDINDVINRALLHKVNIMVCTGTSEKSSKEAADLASKHPGVLYSTAGVHPHDAKLWTSKTADALRELAKRPEVVSIGECGLDFDRNFSEPSVQIKVFEEQIKLAIELKKSLFLHERSASAKLIEILEKYVGQCGKVCVHCFTGTNEELNSYVQMGFYIGITGWICDERRGLDLQKIVKSIPLNRLMIETDAPFLIPRNKNEHLALRQISRNEPCLLPLISKKLAECLSISELDLANFTTQNAKDFFDIK